MDEAVPPLNTYLNVHLAGANAGVHGFRHAAKRIRSHRADLSALASEIAADRQALREIMAELNITEIKPITLLGKVVGRIVRLKPTGRFFGGGPLSDLLEMEGLHDAVSAKLTGWNALMCVADQDGRLSKETVEELVDRANAQLDRIHEMHQQLARDMFGDSHLSG